MTERLYAVDQLGYARSGGICRVCSASELSTLYESLGNCAFTSSQTSLPQKVHVDFCSACGHAQSPPLIDIAEYYDTAYNFRNRDVEEDDIYAVDGNEIVFRAEHQARILEQKLNLEIPLRILDYGCGKASSLRKIVERHSNVVPFTFDVSEAYGKFWNQFVPPANQAFYALPDSWNGQLDVVVSLFALEHVENPRNFVRTLRQLLRAHGQVHVIVPHLYRNASDLLVADHVNHFSEASLRRLFVDAGFGHIEIDSESHRAALIVNATLDSRAGKAIAERREDVIAIEEKARAIAANWESSATKIAEFERVCRGVKTAIYGSGVYGLFIATTLSSLADVAYFVDLNPYRQGLKLFDREVIDPRDIANDVEAILVGLNPQDAKGIIEQSPWLHAVERHFVYL